MRPDLARRWLDARDADERPALLEGYESAAALDRL